MGIDARMFVRIKGRENWLRDEDELKTAVALSSAIGPEHFWIAKSEKSPNAAHALSIIRAPKNAEEARSMYFDENYVGKVVWTQDGPDIVAAEDEQFIEVHLTTRYYDEGYARGDWPTIRIVAEWLEQRFPKGEVWYGGDSSGQCAEPLDEQRRKELNDFYLESGNTTYGGAFSSIFNKGKMLRCPVCEIDMVSCGGGKDQVFFRCCGCGKKAIDGEQTQWLKPNEDFFTANKKG